MFYANSINNSSFSVIHWFSLHPNKLFNFHHLSKLIVILTSRCLASSDLILHISARTTSHVSFTQAKRSFSQMRRHDTKHRPRQSTKVHIFSYFLFSTLTSQRKHLRTLDGLSSSLCRSLDHRIVIFSDVMRRDHQFFCLTLTPYNTLQARSCRLIDDEIATQWKKLVPPKLNPPQICFTAF